MMQQVGAGTLEVTELESWLDAQCPCEFVHANKTACTVLVVALIAGCTMRGRVCQSAVIYKMKLMDFTICTHCKRPAKDCWRIIPI